MSFSERLKRTVKRKADFTCCWCTDRIKKVHVHHIIPQGRGGPDTQENAAPLCGSCHDLLGNNPDFRKEVRLRRDHWYQACEAGTVGLQASFRDRSPTSEQVTALRNALDDAWSTAAELESHLCCGAGTPEIYEARLQEQAHNVYVHVVFLLEVLQLTALLADFRADLNEFRETKRVRFSSDESGNLYADTLGQLARYASPLLTTTGNQSGVRGGGAAQRW